VVERDEALLRGAGAGEDGEAIVLEPAVGVGEAGCAHPVELDFDGGAAVVLLAIEGVGDLLRRGTGFADLLEPELLVELVERGSGAGDLLGIDEDAAGAERCEDFGEERLLGGVVEVVDGETRRRWRPGFGGARRWRSRLLQS